jgi:hypothetical protein
MLMNDDYFIDNYRPVNDNLNFRIEFIKAYSSAIRIDNTQSGIFVWFVN